MTEDLIVQGITTVFVAALAAFGGAKISIAQVVAKQNEMDNRLNRIEDKLDRVIERQE